MTRSKEEGTERCPTIRAKPDALPTPSPDRVSRAQMHPHELLKKATLITERVFSATHNQKCPGHLDQCTSPLATLVQKGSQRLFGRVCFGLVFEPASFYFFFGHVAGVHCGSVQRIFYASLHKREPNVTRTKRTKRKERKAREIREAS